MALSAAIVTGGLLLVAGAYAGGPTKGGCNGHCVQPDFSISVWTTRNDVGRGTNPTSAAALAGGRVVFGIAITPIHLFNGSVSYGLTGTPPICVNCASFQVVDQWHALLVITVPQAGFPRAVPLTITATGQGLVHSATVWAYGRAG